MTDPVLVTGAGGQLGWELQRSAPENITLIALTSAELDISDAEQVNSFVLERQPRVVINAAAYTAVDKAESERQQAYLVNTQGPENLALACQQVGARLIHVSTDFVFDGKKNRPYQPEDQPNPLGVYGESKLAGEIAVRNILGEQGVIIRTGWVYSRHGNNFVKTMLRLMTEKAQLGVVTDQVGTPTWAKGLAECCWAAALRGDASGIYHWSDAGVCSWYDFAVAIQDLALELGLLEKRIPINDIATHAYPTPAKRPTYSVLSKARAIEALAVTPRHWRHQLLHMLNEVR